MGFFSVLFFTLRHLNNFNSHADPKGPSNFLLPRTHCPNRPFRLFALSRHVQQGAKTYRKSPRPIKTTRAGNSSPAIARLPVAKTEAGSRSLSRSRSPEQENAPCDRNSPPRHTR